MQSELEVAALDSPESRGADRRQHERHSYRKTEYLALCNSKLSLSSLMFLPVPCYDISQTGISFHLPSAPAFTRALIKLGKSPNMILAVVEVIHTKQDEQGYLVGCRFVVRI